MKKASTQISRWLMRLIGLVAVSSLTACVTVDFKPADRNQIKTVSVKTPVKIPNGFEYAGRAQVWGAGVGGVIGQAISDTGIGSRDLLIQTMSTNNIDVGEIVKAEFFRAAEAKTAIRPVNANQPADADLSILVNNYGLRSGANTLSPLLYPAMTVTATLTKPDGTVVWRKGDFLTPQNSENNGHELEAYVKDPELLRKALTNASALVSRMLVDHMVQSK